MSQISTLLDKLAKFIYSLLLKHIKSEYSRKFSFEFVAGLQNNMRILYNGDYYNIRSINSVQDSTIWIDVMGDKDIAS